jgi:hypothetical protein
MAINFYSLYFNKTNIFPKIKEGVRIKLKNNILYLNGICAQEIYTKPQERTLEDTDIEKLFFLYPNNSLWIAKEPDGNFYLYKGNIEKNSLFLDNNISDESVYVAVELQKEERATVDIGYVITRVFEEDKQTCIIKLEKNANLLLECEKKIIVIEWTGEKFLYK